MKTKIKLIVCLLILTPWLGGGLYAQNPINVNFNTGSFPTSDYDNGTANDDCPQNAYWISANMQTNCDDFPNRTGNGNFMTVNSDEYEIIPVDEIVYSQAVNNWNGSVGFSISATHRFGSGGGSDPPAPITIDFRANNQTLFTFIIPLTTAWIDFNENNLNIPNNTTNFSLVQTGGGCWNCDYAIDEIMICPNALADFDFLNSSAVYKDEFCYGEEVFIDGSPSRYETNHWFQISQLDANGNAVNWCTPSWQWSSIHIVSLNDVVAAAGCDMTFEPGYTYRVKLAVNNACTNWDEIIKTFSVVCCDRGPYAFDPCFDWASSSSGNDYTFVVTDYERYDDLDVSHDWYVFSSDDSNGPYAPFDHHSGHIFGWGIFQSGTYYTIFHQMTTPCGEFCCAVQIYVHEDFNRSSTMATTANCDACSNDPCSFIDDWWSSTGTARRLSITANKGEQTQQLENGFKAYPNPTTDLFYIDLLTNDTDFESINIYNMNAQLIEQIKINSTNNRNTYQWTPKAELPNGIYVISLSGTNKTIQQRVLLMR